MPRSIAGIAALALVGVCFSTAPAGALDSGRARTGLRAVQRDLDRVTLRIRVETAVWMALVRGVKARQAEVRRRVHPGSVRARRELAAVLPAWIAVKRALHRDYRQVKSSLAQAASLTRRVPIARWHQAWPLRIHGESTFQACPVQGPLSLTDSFGAPRPGGRIHEGNDLFSAPGTPAVAVHSGVVVREGNALGGRAVIVRSSKGYTYYAHFSRYGAMGVVSAGDVIGYVGTSGDAKGLIPHVHFEYHPGGGPAIDPFRFLQTVC